MALGVSNATKGPSLDTQVVAGIDQNYWLSMGMFGLGQEPTNFTNLNNPHPSFLSTLKQRDIIPSLSWSYTAGAPYRESHTPLFLCILFSPKAYGISKPYGFIEVGT